jgi:cathepsin A (carboxypeptidase C)
LTSGKGPAELPAYKAGQFTLTPQDDSVCATNGENQWTGTIDVTDNRRLFFWTFESRNDPKNDPVIFWMNGGPGASSLIGLFTECGACLLPNDTLKTKPNEWAWNNNATVVFLDQPAGVGFSSYKRDEDMPTSDSDGAADFQAFLNIFFDKVFPDKAHLPIHIAAESYGGHYGPVYLDHILESRRHDAKAAFWGNITSLILIDAVIDFAGPTVRHWDKMCNDYRSEGILNETECEALLLATRKAEELGRICEQTNDNAACLNLLNYAEEHISYAFDLKAKAGERSPFHSKLLQILAKEER